MVAVHLCQSRYWRGCILIDHPPPTMEIRRGPMFGSERLNQPSHCIKHEYEMDHTKVCRLRRGDIAQSIIYDHRVSLLYSLIPTYQLYYTLTGRYMICSKHNYLVSSLPFVIPYLTYVAVSRFGKSGACALSGISRYSNRVNIVQAATLKSLFHSSCFLKARLCWVIANSNKDALY